MSGLLSFVLLFAVFAIAISSLVVGSMAYQKAYNLSSSSFTHGVGPTGSTGSSGTIGPTGSTGTIPNPLVNAQLQKALLVGGTPTISQTSGTSFQNPTINAGSNDSSGLIDGEMLAPMNISTFTVTFSAAYPQAPSSVTITPANDIAAGQHIYVSSITTVHFTFSMSKITSGTTAPGAAQFYYLVL